METGDLETKGIYINHHDLYDTDEKMYEEQKNLDTYLMKSEIDVEDSWSTPETLYIS